MRITTISATQKTNTGQYESLELTISAAVDEDDNPAEAAHKLSIFIDWFARKPIRDATYKKHKVIVDSPDTTEEDKAASQKFIDSYEKRKAEVEAL